MTLVLVYFHSELGEFLTKSPLHRTSQPMLTRMSTQQNDNIVSKAASNRSQSLL